MNAHRFFLAALSRTLVSNPHQGRALRPIPALVCLRTRLPMAFVDVFTNCFFQENLGIRPSRTDRPSIIIQFHNSALQGNDSDEIDLEFSLVALANVP
jgi:hypothetical protein